MKQSRHNPSEETGTAKDIFKLAWRCGSTTTTQQYHGLIRCDVPFYKKYNYFKKIHLLYRTPKFIQLMQTVYGGYAIYSGQIRYPIKLCTKGQMLYQ